MGCSCSVSVSSYIRLCVRRYSSRVRTLSITEPTSPPPPPPPRGCLHKIANPFLISASNLPLSPSPVYKKKCESISCIPCILCTILSVKVQLICFWLLQKSDEYMDIAWENGGFKETCSFCILGTFRVHFISF